MHLPGNCPPQVHFQYRKGMVSFQQAVENHSAVVAVIQSSERWTACTLVQERSQVGVVLAGDFQGALFAPVMSINSLFAGEIRMQLFIFQKTAEKR